MIAASISVDLPSVETLRSQGPLEWVQSLFGAKIDLRSGHEELTVSTFSLLQGVCTALERAGVTDAISLVVDRKAVYVDSSGVPADLRLAWQAAEQKGVLGRSFGEMRLALSHVEAGLRTLLEVRVNRRVMVGEAEMLLVFSSRVEQLSVQTGETAAAYAERVRTFVGTPRAVEPFRLALDSLVARVARELQQSLVGARVKPLPAHATLIRPGKQQISRFRKLGWGADVQATRYRPVPTARGAGAYQDPYFYYWYDPYYDFTTFLMYDAMLHHGALHDPTVIVVAPDGTPLHSGADAAAYAPSWEGNGAVGVAPDGSLAVDSSIPDAAGSGDPVADASTGWGGSDTASSDAGWGGSDTSSSDAGWGGSDTGGSDSGGSSSCGGSSSSCSGGSSCGSSCGGGGGD